MDAAASQLDNRSRYLEFIRSQSEPNGLPADVAGAVAHVESGYRPESKPDIDEVGLMQVRLGTAAMLGFRGNDNELAIPETNRHAVTYLARAWRLAKGDLCRALMKYRAGHGEERTSQLRLHNFVRAKMYLSQINSPLATEALTTNLLSLDSTRARSHSAPSSSGSRMKHACDS